MACRRGGPHEEKVVMLVGNTGVGKSSIGCRLLGCKPFGKNHNQRPFEVAATSEAVTTKLQTHSGSWLGEEVDGHSFPVTIVDTPGLNDPKGVMIDTANMADIGSYLEKHPVNCVWFVLTATNPRIDQTMKRLINIIIQKVNRMDYGKLGFVVNHYRHTEAAKAERAEFSDGLSERQSQNNLRAEIEKSLKGYAEEDNLNLNERDIELFGKRIFLLNSHYLEATAADGDAEAFVGFRDCCLTCDLLHRELLTEGVAPIHPAWEAAKSKVEDLEQEAAQAKKLHQEKLELIEAQAAQQRAAAEHKHAEAVAEAKQQQERHAQELRDEQDRSDEFIAAEMRRFEDDNQQRDARHREELKQMHEQIENNKKLEEERDRAQQAQIQAAKELAAKSAEVEIANLKAEHERQQAQSKQPNGFFGAMGAVADHMLGI
ncbi:TPA: hypothetical protein ACH3X2_007418 [Trebouxia sp. C0005]